MRPLLPLLLLAAAHGREIRDIPYVANGGPLQSLDLHLPDGKDGPPRPVLVAIHGGGWSGGDKASRSFLEPKTRWFNEHGFIVASVNYRLSPQVRHPAHIDDVCSAIAWIQDHIARHGGDPKRIHLLGHSAGAHLAALAGVDRERQAKAGIDPAAIRGVILLDGAAYDVPLQVRDGSPLARVKRMYADAFTTDPEVQRDASPALKVGAAPPPFLILHVARRPGSTLQARRLADALQAKGATAAVLAIPGKDHMTINRDFGKPGDPTTVAAAAFLKPGD